MKTGTPSHFKTFYLYENQFYPEMESRKSLITRLFLFVLGLTAMATQIIMIREFLAVFQGNELVIGLFLGFWMLLTATGSFIASKLSSQFPSTIDNRQSKITQFLLLLLALLPLTMLFSLSFFRSYFIPIGVMAGIGEISLILFLVLTPFCLVSGILFPLLVNELSALKEKNLLHEGYALDSAGSILGGLLFSLVFIFILKPFESLLILTFTCIIVAVAWKRRGLGDWMIGRFGGWAIGRLGGWAIEGVVLLLFIFIILTISFIVRPDGLLNSLSFKNQQVLETKTTPFGKLTITRLGEQINLYENGVPVISGDDPVFREESVHYAMLLHPRPENVLLISGGTGGTIEEILKYPVKKIDYLEINPWMIRLIGKYRPFPADVRISYIYKDPRIFLAKSGQRYDIILLNTPEPSSAELNRFYTLEFFQLLKDKLNPGGIVSLSLPAAGNYMSETSRMAHSVLYNTLQTVFTHIKIIPGWKDYYIVSDTSLEHSCFNNYPALGFTNIYVNPSYINEDIQKMRSNLIMKDILTEAPINLDLKPYIFSLFLRHWLSQFRANYLIIPVLLAVMTVLGFIFLGPLNLGLFAGGFTASALEFLLLIWFQVLYGYVYQMTGVIFAVFMTGIAIGSFYRLRFYNNSTFRGFLTVQGIFAGFSALLAGLMLLIPSKSINWMITLLILILVFISGLLMGIQFSLSGQLRKTNILQSSGESFSADLLGSAIGIGLVAVYLIPQFGLPMTGMVLAGLNIVAIGVIYVKGS